MPARATPPPAPRLLFLGMTGQFSALALAGLLAAGLPLAGVVAPAPPGAPPIARREPPRTRMLPLLAAGAPTILELAWQQGVPVWALGDPTHPAALAALAGGRPDLITVACFPRRLPAGLLALAPLGGLNLHPSLLPAGRGPAPRFWTFRHGLARTGLTVHQLTAELDGGPIVAQTAVEVPDGLTGAAFDHLTGRLGGALLAETAVRLAAGAADPRPQDPAAARYDPWPAAADYLVTPDRPARWAYNFIRGVAGDGGPLAVAVDGRAVPVIEALGYAPADRLGQPWRAAGEELWLQCSPGVLHVRVRPAARGSLERDQ